MAAYEKASIGERVEIGKDRSKPGTVSALVASYYRTSDFKGLSDSTKATYRGIIERFRAEHGDKRVAQMERRHVQSIVAAKAETPSAANNLLRMIHLLMRHAVELGWRGDDPTRDVRKAKEKTGGFLTWEEEHIEAFIAQHKPGTRAHLALSLLLYTGQRRSDVVRMGRQHVRNGVLSIVQQKTGQDVHIPLHPELKATLDRLPLNNLAFLVTAQGKLFTPAGFTNWFRAMVREAKLPDSLSPHGLRKATCRRLAEVDALDKVVKEQKDLQTRIQAANKPASGGGGGRRHGGGGGGGGSRAAGAAEEENALARLKKSVDDRILSLQNENTALQLVATGQAKNVDSAKLMVEAMAANGGQIDATTGAMIRQIDALTKLNEHLKEAARDPVREFMNSLPSWQKTGNDITEGVIGNIQSSLPDLMTGDFTFEGLADALLGTFADAFAPLATGELMKLTGLDKALTKSNDWIAALGANSTLSADGAGVAQGGAQAGQSIAAAMTQAGATVAQQIGAAMTGAGGQAQIALQTGVTSGGMQAANAQRAAGMTHATQVRAATIQGGQQLGQGVVLGSQQGAPILAQGVASGAAMGGTGGGLLSGVGGWSGLLTMALGAFEEGGVSTSPVGFASAPASAFRHAPHFSQGTTNTSGIPAVLHPNEAVIPLSKGRKIGVELNGDSAAGGSTGPTVQNINFQVTTPNPDAFRKSRSQVEADLARAGNRGLRKNG
ncbi:tyrosine-type recombinase/integrase [Rhodobacter capsulatus]|uniref:tyrosine-type recombinase/integrase n=1 Tax=Rhodobacter capsulatus TaxID=1061 RepID=UPI004026C710